MAEYIIKLDKALYDPDTGAAVFKPEFIGELIRCKECKYWKAINNTVFGICENDTTLVTTKYNHFCKSAERKEDGNEI